VKKSEKKRKRSDSDYAEHEKLKKVRVTGDQGKKSHSFLLLILIFRKST